ncbi:DUF1961 family protein [Butyrivibrio sp. VCB2006]|uniref:DUF1961 family protein n=1 Tax=Butyrivibrio sp. VCB2006 TaxID=1280679 RepID=UPI0003FCB5F9|nr:DUF1961 family protein [Butyrivibrio sp. VCB2006]
MSKVIYENPLNNEACLQDFALEGRANISFSKGVMRLESELGPDVGQRANFVLWCKQPFPSDVLIEWEFRPVKEPGLAMLFFAAKGRNGAPIFDGSLSPRTGEYSQYHSGDINAFHVSYFRRKEDNERAFHTCNLRKSYGFNLVAQGADPIPDASEDSPWYSISVIKKSGKIQFFINHLQIFEFDDDGISYGDILTGGCIGFRQLSPMIAEYRNLRVTWI